MNKMSDLNKIIITAILSIFITVLGFSFTVIKNKADKEYVDSEDKEIVTRIDKVEADYQRECQDIKADYQREMNQLNETMSEVQKDVKKILEKL